MDHEIITTGQKMTKLSENIYPVWKTCITFLGASVLLMMSCQKKLPENNIQDFSEDKSQAEISSVNRKSSALEKRKDVIMSPQQIVEQIKLKNWELVSEPGQVGPDAGTSILALLNEPDSEVRELALHALNQVGGKVARQGFLRALKDQDDMVRSVAGQFLLNHHHSEDLPALKKELVQHEEESVREDVALVIGKIGDKNTIDILMTQANQETDEDARHAMSLALARLGEPKNRQAYLQRLQQNDPKQRALALHDFIYISDRSMLNDIAPLLDDLRDALNVAPSDSKHYIRVADVAVNVLDAALDHPFSFQIDHQRKYTTEELKEAKLVIQKIK